MKRPLLAFAALALGGLLAVPLVAQAATYVVAVPVAVQQPVVVAQARPWETAHMLTGRVSAFGGFSMTLQVQSEPLPVHLHQGTIIRPTNLTIKPGMRVRVFGYWQNGAFQADRIVLLY